MKRISVVVLLLIAALGVVGVGPTRANPSLWCQDGTTTEIERVLISSPVKIGVAVNPSGQVQVCYSTGALSPGTGAGAAGVTVTPSPSASGTGIWVYCMSDPGVRQPVNCDQYAKANVAPGTSGTSAGPGGATLGIQIPFQVCAGSISSPGCTGTSPNLGTSGLIVGTLVPMAGPTGSTGAGYSVSGVEVWLDGTRLYSSAAVPVAGGYVNTAGAPSLAVPSVGGSNPPCIIGGVCTPSVSGSLAVTGSTQTVTLVLPTGTSTFPVTIPSRCLVNFSGPC